MTTRDVVELAGAAHDLGYDGFGIPTMQDPYAVAKSVATAARRVISPCGANPSRRPCSC